MGQGLGDAHAESFLRVLVARGLGVARVVPLASR